MPKKWSIKLPPGSIDLFGNVTPLQTWEQKYREYINSSTWKKKCAEAIKKVDDKCQKCGFHKLVRPLNVHHIRYDNLGNEPPEDLLVVCTKCHKIEDLKRSIETARRNNEKLQDARFEGWARAVYGDNWMIHYDEYTLYLEFEDWIFRNDY